MRVAIKIISDNRKAHFDYQILDKFEAGIVLVGSEVKSLRNGQCQLKDSYVAFVGDQAFLQSAHISEYKHSNINNHVPERKRKLLLHRRELDTLYGQMREKGLSCVPLKMYFKRGKVKVEIALVKGKKQADKRESIKKRDANREVAKVMRRDR